MIISRKFGFIALKTKKTAGTSLEILLSKYAGPDDVLTELGGRDNLTRRNLGYRGPQRCYVPGYRLTKSNIASLVTTGKPLKLRNHEPARTIKENFPKEWKTYLKVAVRRNPFDRIVSGFYFRNPEGNDVLFREWLFENEKALTVNERITSIGGESVVDFYISYDNFAEDLSEFARITGLPRDLPKYFRQIRAKSHFRPKTATVSHMFGNFPEGVRFVEEKCRAEIARFGYEIPKA